MLIPSTLVLPYYARPDLAWLEAINLTPGGHGQGFVNYTPPSGYIDLVLAHFTQYTTSAVVGNRLYALTFFTPGGPLKFYSPAPLAQAASLAYNYSFSIDGAVTSQSMNNGGATGPLLPMPMMPGDILQAVAINGSINDTWSQVSVSVMHIPTGPPNHNPDESPIHATEQALLPASAFA